MAILSALCGIFALGCIMVGMVRVKLDQPDSVPFVIGFFVLLALAIFFAWLDKKRRHKEWLVLRRDLGRR